MELEKLEGDVDRDIRLAWMALESAREAQDEVALEVTLAEQAFELAERSYQAGLATWLDVEQARTSLSGAQLASISSRAELDLAGIALVSAMGMLGT